MVTRGQLEKQTSHIIRAKQIGDITKILYQFPSALKTFGMRDKFTDFHRINKTASSCLRHDLTVANVGQE